MKLAGGLQIRGGKWDLDSFGALFHRLKQGVEHADDPIRHVGYEGFDGDRCDVRFFGVEVREIGNIPEGMVGWDLRENTWAVLDHSGDSWEGSLTWNWSDNSLAEFTAACPSEWSAEPPHAPHEFRISANVYIARGKSLDDEVHLVDYDDSWPRRYEEMASWLAESLGPDLAPRIEHYGSTAIPGMPAKPVIDILVEVPSFEEARRRAVPVFNKPECEYWFYSDHMVFIVREEFMGKRTHHIHMAPARHRIWDGLAFRDYLRTHPDGASRYVALKRKLADRHQTDRERYTIAKEDFVREVTAKAIELTAD
jgi:GrpB-like predicted nucleotidyltransferase (UPF0157 family)